MATAEQFAARVGDGMALGMMARRSSMVPPSAQLWLRLEANWTLRIAVLRGLGAALILSSVGMWLMPGVAVDPEMNLIRMGISLAFLLAGLVLMSVFDRGARPEACFDPIRRELRVMRSDSQGRSRTILRRSYETLGGVRLTADQVQMFEADGSLLMSLPIASAAMRSQLRDQLSGAVRILT
jgi:hypothetical protein